MPCNSFEVHYLQAASVHR